MHWSMSSPVTELRTLINIDVPEMEAGIVFYTRALPLRVGRRFGAGAVELLGAQSPIYLLAKPPGSRPFDPSSATDGAGARSYDRHWTPVHLDLIVPELMPAVERARAAGASVESISSHVWGELALLADPFGHGFCLIEFRGRGYDELVTEGPSTR